MFAKCNVVLFDRDATIVVDEPANTNPRSVQLMPTAAQAIALARSAECKLGVVSNQPGIALGTTTSAAFSQKLDRIEELVGKFDQWFVCPHATDTGCACRKPQPGLILTAARYFGVDPSACAVIGDIGSDIDAATAAGAVGILVPTAVTKQQEIARAPFVCATLEEAVRLVLGQ